MTCAHASAAPRSKETTHQISPKIYCPAFMVHKQSSKKNNSSYSHFLCKERWQRQLYSYSFWLFFYLIWQVQRDLCSLLQPFRVAERHSAAALHTPQDSICPVEGRKGLCPSGQLLAEPAPALAAGWVSQIAAVLLKDHIQSSIILD